MKHSFVLALTFTAIAGCASSAATSEEQAWAECNAIADRAVRANCITIALADAKAEERAAEAKAKQDFESGAKAIEDKAAIEQALGAPASETGTTIVREPFEQ